MPKRTISGTGKKFPLNMRTTAELRAKINKAAGKSGRSLVQEVEYRVERTFMADDMLKEMRELRQDVVNMLHGINGKLATIDGLWRDIGWVQNMSTYLHDIRQDIAERGTHG